MWFYIIEKFTISCQYLPLSDILLQSLTSLIHHVDSEDHVASTSSSIVDYYYGRPAYIHEAYLLFSSLDIELVIE